MTSRRTVFYGDEENVGHFISAVIQTHSHRNSGAKQREPRSEGKAAPYRSFQIHGCFANLFVHFLHSALVIFGGDLNSAEKQRNSGTAKLWFCIIVKITKKEQLHCHTQSYFHVVFSPQAKRLLQNTLLDNFTSQLNVYDISSDYFDVAVCSRNPEPNTLTPSENSSSGKLGTSQGEPVIAGLLLQQISETQTAHRVHVDGHVGLRGRLVV